MHKMMKYQNCMHEGYIFGDTVIYDMTAIQPTNLLLSLFQNTLSLKVCVLSYTQSLPPPLAYSPT